MPDILKGPAIVIAGRDLGESDRLVTLYTSARGKVKGIAKGAKRSRRRFVNALEPFTLVELTLVSHRSAGLARIDAAEILESFPLLPGAVATYGMACLSCELVDMWTREGDSQEKVFRLLLWCLRSLQESRYSQRTALVFKTKLLALAGYAPEWERCISCKRAPVGAHVTFRPHDGGFLCTACYPEKGNNAVGLGCLRTLGHIQKRSLQELQRLAMAPQVLGEAWHLMRRLHCHYLDATPASYGVLRGLCMDAPP